MEEQRCALGETEVSYRVLRSPRWKSLRLIVSAEEGVVFKAPLDLDEQVMRRVLQERAPWVLRRMREAGLGEPGAGSLEFVGGESHRYLGGQYRLYMIEQAGARGPLVEIAGGFLRVSLPPGLAPARRAVIVRGALERWFRARAEERIPERVALYAARAGIVAPPVRICRYDKRWGGCDARGRVYFNWQLVMAPLMLIDYVVAHELCHLRHPNHSPAFWRLLGVLLPDFRERRERLRVFGAEIQSRWRAPWIDPTPPADADPSPPPGKSR